jgi:RNA polymerase sigma-70 factor (ECF subfamily)
MANEDQFPIEDPLEALLDEESDDEFGAPITKDHNSVKLAEWSAQDFSNIYVRFRPHLERHAKRFLRNPSQVDEVVQDAFLYLMVSLPELDSEIGVLRFLKWKVRLLCLDVIRASGKAYLHSIDDVAEPIANDPEVSSYLEQQDDAAVLRLALSKLTPRHREVLLASVYEEKSTLEIAGQVGLTENATRQLIFRARAAFKKALLGEDVNTDGMTAAAILSVAARKAAAEAKKVGAQAMVFALFLMIAIGGFISLNGRSNTGQTVAEGPGSSSQPSAEPSASASQNAAPANKPVAKPSASASAVANSGTSFVVDTFDSTSTPSPSISPFTEAGLDKVFDSKNSEVVFVKTSVTAPTVAASDAVSVATDYRAYASQGIFADFTYQDGAYRPFSNIQLSFLIDNKAYFAKVSQTDVVSAIAPDGLKHVVFYGSFDYIVDRKGRVAADDTLSTGTVRLEVVIKSDRTGLDSIHLDVLKN